MTVSELPDTIFKYQGFNVLSLQNLKAQAIYFASPSQFKDPYDCAITAGFHDPTPDEVEAMRQHYLRKLPSARTEWESLT